MWFKPHKSQAPCCSRNLCSRPKLSYTRKAFSGVCCRRPPPLRHPSSPLRDNVHGNKFGEAQPFRVVLTGELHELVKGPKFRLFSAPFCSSCTFKEGFTRTTKMAAKRCEASSSFGHWCEGPQKEGAATCSCLINLSTSDAIPITIRYPPT